MDSSGTAASDVHFFIDGDALMIEETASSSDRGRATERYFISGIRKHAEIAQDLKRNVRKYGLQ